MSTRNIVNSNFYKIAVVDANLIPTGINTTNIISNTLLTTGNVTFSGPSVNVGSIANLHISGGNANQYLKTDGTGNLVWSNVSVPGVVSNVDTAGSGLGFTLTGGPITSTGTVALTVPTASVLRTNLNIGNIANINLTGNGSQFLAGNGAWLAGGGGSGTVSNVTGNGAGLGFVLTGTVTSTGNLTLTVPTAGTLITNLGIGNIYPTNLTGNGQQVLLGNGSWGGLSTGSPGGSNTQLQFNDGGTFGAVTSITYNKTINTPKIQQFKEQITLTGTAMTGTINYDVLNGAILYYNANATANATINFRGNSTTAMNTVMNTGESLTVTFINDNGTTAYLPTAYQVDGATVIPKWLGGAPTGANTSNTMMYTFNIVKTAASTYTIFGSQARFQ